MGDSSDVVEMEVFRWLPQVDVVKLEEVCGTLNVTIPDDKKGNKSLLLKLILRTLNSEIFEALDDSGLSSFLEIHRILKDIIKIEPEKQDVKTENIVETRSIFENTIQGNSALKVHRLREFKINGTIGSIEQKDNLSYTSLSFQIEKGKKAGYSVDDIQLAVIKSIKPGSSLRVYLESKVDISEQVFLQILRSHYKEKDSTSVFQEMSNCMQSPTESELDFCMRAMSLREKVLTLSREEDCPFDETLVRKRFFHAVFTGLKHNNMRLELKKTLTEGTMADEELLQEISSTASIEMEHLNKFSKKSTVYEISASENKSSNKSRCSENLSDKINKVDDKNDTLMLAEIKKLSVQLNELSGVKEELSTLKKQFHDNFSNPPPAPPNGFRPGEYNPRRRPRRLFRCRDCESKNLQFCDHCFSCGSTEHRKKFCTHFQKNE